MATKFKDWALRYVLADEDTVRNEIATEAAREIESSQASRPVLGSWAASVGEWLVSPTEGNDGSVEDGEETQGGGDIVARAKALDFLATTLQALDKSILKPDQVKMLVAFFGSMFNNDTKAGITASAKALRQLTTAKNFKPQLGVKMIQDVCQLKEDFRLQTAATRFDLYELFQHLIQDPAVASELQHEYGASSGFIVDLVQLCSHERDPKNLMVWFDIITALLADYAPSDEVTEELFKTFSNYFPISMRSSATSLGVTADDLKVALRQCFSAHQRLARLTFPYLVQRLDQGDAVTVAVKIDILKTLQACIERYDNPQSSLVPYIDKIWNSLKYEVRNGEVQETSDATLEVLRAIGTKLNGTASEPLDLELVKNYIDLVFGDSLEDLSNPTYTKQAGQLCATVVASSLRAFLLDGLRLVNAITENIRQPKSPSHTKDLLFLLNALLKERRTFTQSVRDRTAFLLENPLEKDTTAFKALFHQVYLPLWRQTSSNPFGEHTGLFKEVIKGLALLVGQQSFVSDGSENALHSAEECREIASLLSHKVLEPLTLSANDRVGAVPDVEQELTQALRTVIVESGCVYEPLLVNLKAAMMTRDWKAPSERSVQDLQEIIARIAYVTSSELPALEALPNGPVRNQLDSFVCLSSVLLQTFDSLLAKKAHPVILGLIVAGLHGAMLNFRDACAPLPKEVAILPSLTSKGAVDWDGLFKEAISGTKKTAGAGLWHWSDLLPDQCRDLRAQGPQTEREHNVFADFTRLSLYAVRYLYLRVTTFIPSAHDQPEDTASPTIRLADDLWNLCQDVGCSVEPLIVQLGGMSSLVIRSLDATSQGLLKLGVEGFRLFRDLDMDVEKTRLPKRAVQLDGLTLGILESLWPDAMVDLYKPKGLALESVNSYLDSTFDIRDTRNDCANGVVSVLANKHKQSGQSPDAEPAFYQSILGNAIEHLDRGLSDPRLDQQPEIGMGLVYQAITVLEGGFPRQDKHIPRHVPVLHKAIAHGVSRVGWYAALSLDRLVREHPYLSNDGHAIIRPLYKQWAYAILAKPLYSSALPVNQEYPQGLNNAMAILSVIRRCSFAVYGDDVQDIVRLIVATLQKLLGPDTGYASASDAIAALVVLQEILDKDHLALREHLPSIMENLVKAVARPTEVSGRKPPSAYCRKLGVQILSGLPSKFEEHYLLRYSLQINRLLAESCGDPVRDVRREAMAARERWAKIN